MKAAGRRSDGNAPATILIAVLLLGCVAISAQCGRVPTDLAGESGEVTTVAGSLGGDERPSAMAESVCYRVCSGGLGLCHYCCRSPYTPTGCWPTQGECGQKCHPPSSASQYPHKQRQNSE